MHLNYAEQSRLAGMYHKELEERRDGCLKDAQNFRKTIDALRECQQNADTPQIILTGIVYLMSAELDVMTRALLDAMLLRRMDVCNPQSARDALAAVLEESNSKLQDDKADSRERPVLEIMAEECAEVEFIFNGIDMEFDADLKAAYQAAEEINAAGQEG